MDIEGSPHPTDQALGGLGLGTLVDGSAGAVRAHLEACPRCRERAAAISGLGLPASAPEVSPPPQAGATASFHGPGPSGWPDEDALDSGLAGFPDYELRRELGRGGMGVVYLAHNTLMGRDEVLKVMGRQVVDKPGVLERFLREIRAVARLRHENIVTAYSAARVGENIAFAMEYVEGLDLSRMVRAKGPLPVAHACHFAYQAALGLQHAHEEGLVHRDIKPGNLMLTRKGKKATIKVLDFGLAKVTHADSLAEALTQEGQALGTPDFIAPEQITDAQSVDIRADIYSLGATLYYLLTGRPPFRASSFYAMLQAHLSREPEPLDLVRPEVPPELAAVVARMMAKDPAGRFQTPAEVARALRPFFREGGAAFRSPDAEFSSSGGLDAPDPPGGPAAGARPGGRGVVPGTRSGRSTAPEVRWESLIEFHEDDPDEPTPPVSGPARLPAWARPSIAAGVLILGLLAGWFAIGLRVRTDKGELVFDGLPDDAVVTVDGQVVDLEWPGSDGPARVSVAAGGHSVKVEVKGVEVAGDEVKLKAGDRKWVRVRFEPAVAAPVEKKPPPAEEPKPVAVDPPRTEVAATAKAPAPGPPAGSPPSPASTPALPPDVLHLDTFDDPKGGWPQEDPNLPRKVGDPYHYGYANGVWFNSGSGFAEWSQPAPYTLESDFELTVDGRVLDATPESRGRWTVHIRPADPALRGFQVAIERNGVLVLEPSFWDKTSLPGDPRIGPIALRGFREGTEFNTLVLRVRRRQVEILCNGARVGPPVTFDRDLTPSLIHLGVDGYKGSYRAEFDRIEVKTLAGEPAAPGDVPAPPVARTPNLLFVDEFDDPRTGWARDESGEPGAVNQGRGYRNGIFSLVQSGPGAVSYASARDFGGDFQVEVSGRVLDATPESSGLWAVHLIPRAPGLRGLQVGIDRDGLLLLEPTFWHKDEAAGDPRLGPIPIRNFRRGNRFNTLTLRVRRHRVEVLVNSVRVGPIITYGWDLTPAALHLGINVGGGNARAEFDRVEVRELPPPPATDPTR